VLQHINSKSFCHRASNGRAIAQYQRMKVLLNTTTLAIGGALQLATSSILEALRDPLGIDWRFALSKGVYDQVRRFHSDPIPHAEVFDDTPAKSRDARRRLKALETAIGPDCVFTPYGPAYVQFAAPHLMGAANPWVAHADIHAYRIMGFPLEGLQTFVLSIYRGYWFRKAEMLVVETEYVRQGYWRRVGVPLSRIAVVANTCGQHYLDRQGSQPFPESGSRIRILCFAAPHKHKRVEIVPQVAKALASKRPELDFEFVTTINEGDPVLKAMNSSAKALGVEARINNLGPVPVAKGPELYESCHICFLPTVLECFSATYPEAMAMGLPIVTTDLGFLRDVCRDAALYFPPNDAGRAADRLLTLLDSQAIWNRLIQAGKHMLSGLPTAPQKYRQYAGLLERLLHNFGPDAAKALQPQFTIVGERDSVT
jgi:glycosyltransferase involved in cell wall biosynthesis